MSKHAIILCVLLSAVWMPSARGQDLVLDEELSRIDYYKFWQAHLPLQDGEEVIEFHLVGENLYSITNRSVLYAIHADVGTIRWSVRLGGKGHRIFTPTHVRSFWGRDLTLVSTSEKVVWLDRASGETVAKLNIDFIPSTSAVSDGVRVYVAGLDKILYCYEFVPTAGGASTILKWRIKTGEFTTSSPVLWGGGLFLASQDGRVLSCDSRDKTGFWTFRSRAANSADIHVDSTGVYFGSTDRSIYRLDVRTGRGLWRVRTPGSLFGRPVLIGDNMYQKIDGHGFYVINADSGELMWKLPQAKEFICASDNAAYLLGQQGDVLAVNPKTGSIDARFYAGVDLVAGNPASGAMFLASRDGRLLCAQDKSVPFLRFEQLLPERAAAASIGDEQPTSRQPGVQRKQPELVDLLRSNVEVPPLGE